jgi:hypothetical protein
MSDNGRYPETVVSRARAHTTHTASFKLPAKPRLRLHAGFSNDILLISQFRPQVNHLKTISSLLEYKLRSWSLRNIVHLAVICLLFFFQVFHSGLLSHIRCIRSTSPCNEVGSVVCYVNEVRHHILCHTPALL